jgi:hypothetical protein
MAGARSAITLGVRVEVRDDGNEKCEEEKDKPADDSGRGLERQVEQNDSNRALLAILLAIARRDGLTFADALIS